MVSKKIQDVAKFVFFCSKTNRPDNLAIEKSTSISGVYFVWKKINCRNFGNLKNRKFRKPTQFWIDFLDFSFKYRQQNWCRAGQNPKTFFFQRVFVNKNHTYEFSRNFTKIQHFSEKNVSEFSNP
jgi:hypothetical protein